MGHLPVPTGFPYVFDFLFFGQGRGGSMKKKHNEISLYCFFGQGRGGSGKNIHFLYRGWDGASGAEGGASCWGMGWSERSRRRSELLVLQTTTTTTTTKTTTTTTTTINLN